MLIKKGNNKTESQQDPFIWFKPHLENHLRDTQFKSGVIIDQYGRNLDTDASIKACRFTRCKIPLEKDLIKIPLAAFVLLDAQRRTTEQIYNAFHTIAKMLKLFSL